MTPHRHVLALGLAAAAASCVQFQPQDPSGPETPSFDVTGQVIDFMTAQPVQDVGVQILGIVPSPTITVNGSMFSLDGIPPESVFYVLGSAGGYVNTYKTLAVKDGDESGLVAEIVKFADLESLAAAFSITVDPTRSVLLGRVVDDSGEPVAGVMAADFELSDQAQAGGPFFLDAQKTADPALSATSSSGYFLFFDLQPKPLAVRGAQNGTYGLTMPVSPAGSAAVTLADVVARQGGAVPLPTNVSFASDVVPIFTRRACTACHDDKAAGSALGGLDLANLDISRVYHEAAMELSPSIARPRVDTGNPAASLLLTKPGPPIGDHPNLTFASEDDPDYKIILAWISEGAKNN